MAGWAEAAEAARAARAAAAAEGGDGGGGLGGGWLAGAVEGWGAVAVAVTMAARVAVAALEQGGAASGYSSTCAPAVPVEMEVRRVALRAVHIPAWPGVRVGVRARVGAVV